MLDYNKLKAIASEEEAMELEPHIEAYNRIRSLLMRAAGSARSAKKIEASRVNGTKYGGRQKRKSAVKTQD